MSSRPAIILRRVDFPQPEAPTSTTNSLSFMVKSTLSITFFVSYILVTFFKITLLIKSPLIIFLLRLFILEFSFLFLQE